MGAGSPEHELGDTAINEMGIVQGHAYAILDMKEVGSARLIKIRNPHGSRGVEWNGDWGDDSEMWDQRAINKCNHENESDGVFWMDVDDFTEQFSYIYICRMVKGWKHADAKSEWRGESAEGLPSRRNPKAKLEKNPQFGLRVPSPGVAFIKMSQKDQENMFRGKHNIMFMVSRNGGERITRVDKKKLVIMSGPPINLNTITAEIRFDKSVSYPYTYTLLAANTEQRPEGEGEFELDVFSPNEIKLTELEAA